MSVIDLSDISGLPVTFDDESCKLCNQDQIQYKQEMEIGLNEIAPILLNKFLRYPENVGYIYKEVEYKNDALPTAGSGKHKYDIYVIPFGLLGIEFNKTHVFYCPNVKDKYAGIIEVLRSEVTVIIQRNGIADQSSSLNTIVEEMEIVSLQKGEKMAIPSGVMFSFVNTGATEALFSFVSSNKTEKIDYNNLKREKGLAYYIISKNAKSEIVANPKYKVQNPPKNETLKNMTGEAKNQFQIDFLNCGVPLYKFLMEREAEIDAMIV